METEFVDYCVEKIDEYLAQQNIEPLVKRKFKETAKIHGIVYKFPHFGIEVVHNEITLFGKYKSQYFDAELFETTDKLVEDLLPAILYFYQNPAITKHPLIRFFHRFKK